jgi:hypothetical protein
MDAKKLNQLEQDAAKELGATTQHGFHAATVLALIQHIRECQAALKPGDKVATMQAIVDSNTGFKRDAAPTAQTPKQCWACNDTGIVTTSSNGSGLIDEPCAACGEAAPPAQTPPRLTDTAVEACIKAVEDAFAWTGGHGEPSKPGPDAIANIIRSHFHVVQTPPPRLTDSVVTTAEENVWSLDFLDDTERDANMEFARAIETAVRKQFGVQE